MTITIDKATLELIRKKVGPRGVSNFIADAARDHVSRNALLDYLEELDEKYGPVPAEVYARTDRELRAHFKMPSPKVPWDGGTMVEPPASTRATPARQRRTHVKRRISRRSSR